LYDYTCESFFKILRLSFFFLSIDRQNDNIWKLKNTKVVESDVVWTPITTHGLTILAILFIELGLVDSNSSSINTIIIDLCN